MGKINDLIAEGKLKDAAEMVYDSLYTIINNGSYTFNINRAEFDKVAPELIKKMQNPESEKEPTPDVPGDDVEVIDPHNTALLTINFEGVEGMTSLTKKIIVGLKYNYIPPAIEGYEVTPEAATGTMTEDGAEVTFKYTEAEPTVTHRLTVTYGSDDPSFTKPNDYVAEVAEGDAYEVTSPVVEGFTADKATVTGTMGTEDVTETVTYTKNVVEKGTLIITYEGPDDGTFVAPDPVEEEVVVGEQYSVESPVVEGYTPDVEVVDGVMTSGGEDVTVTYEKDAEMDTNGDSGEGDL